MNYQEWALGSSRRPKDTCNFRKGNDMERRDPWDSITVRIGSQGIPRDSWEGTMTREPLGISKGDSITIHDRIRRAQIQFRNCVMGSSKWSGQDVRFEERPDIVRKQEGPGIERMFSHLLSGGGNRIEGYWKRRQKYVQQHLRSFCFGMLYRWIWLALALNSDSIKNDRQTRRIN